MNLSYTLCGGFGDFILRYLGYPGNRLSHLVKTYPNIEFRLSNKPAGIDLVKGSPFFLNAAIFDKANDFTSSRLKNDISNIAELKQYPKIIPPIWLSEEEEHRLVSIKKPYIAFHPFAGDKSVVINRNIDDVFNIERIIDWIKQTTNMQVVVLGDEDFSYKNAINLNGASSRLSVRVVQNSSMFVGTHSAMQCAAWVYDIPSLCIAPYSIVLHGYFAPHSFHVYLKPLFRNNVLMFKEQAERFPEFFDYFLRKATSLKPLTSPEQFHKKSALLGMVFDPFLI